MSKTKKATARQAAQVLDEVHRTYGDGAVLWMNWEWAGWETASIVWEDGPYGWAQDFDSLSHEPEKIVMPSRVWVEPQTDWALAVWQEVAS